MKLLSLAVAAVSAGAVAGAAQAAPALERAAADVAAAPPGSDIRLHFGHFQPSASAEQRAVNATAFDAMAATQPTLPFYTRSYAVPVVNENLGAAPPVPTTLTFQHTLLGTDPSLKSLQGVQGVASTVSVRLIPVVITLPDKTVLDPSVELVPGQLNNSIVLDQSSPVFTFQPLTLGGVNYGSTQLLDAWVRGERWRYAQYLPNYHLYLAPSVGAKLQVAPTAQQLWDASAMPAPDGSTLGARLGRVFVFDSAWLNQQIQAYLQTQAIDPSVITVFVTSYNILAQSGGGLAAGYHFNFGTQTFIWHGYEVPQQTPLATQVQGQILQHELAELIDHPFPTSTPDQAACTPTGYESGDPLEDGRADFTVTNSLGMNYRFQDLTFASWNEGETPSSAVLGRYTLQNAFRYPCF
jgi:hypothetical protein